MLYLNRLRQLLQLPAGTALLALLLPTAVGAAVSGQDRVTFGDSIKSVSAAAQGVSAVAHRVVLVRTSLKPEEVAASMEVEVVLRMRNFAELQSRLARGELIPLAEMALKYHPTAADYGRVVAWLAGQGLRITGTNGNHLAVFASGRVDLVAKVFNVSFARVALDGIEYTSAITAPSLPADVAPPVLAIHGLQPHLRLHRLTGAKVLRSQFVQGYTPAQILNAYNAVIPGTTGTGQIIAVVGDAFPSSTDLTSFWSQAGVSQSISNVAFISVSGGPTSPASGDVQEITLDTEWSSSIAPGARVRVYGIPDLNNSSFDKAYQQVASDVQANPGLHQFSISYGGGEEDLTNVYLLTESQYMAELASAGVSVFSASGDNGAYSDGNSVLQVTYPASDPSVTGVGGTSIQNINSIPPTEFAWSDSGGGISRNFSRPSWQSGQGISGTQRLVPDVSASADPNYGAFLVFQGISNQPVGGTSWASPTWAGFCALINQSIGGTTGLGALNPKLYPLLGTSAFRDITSGSNGTYNAGVGYDMVTGIGVPNVTNLIAALNSSGSAPSIISQLGSQVTVLGQASAFSVSAVGENPLTYKWQRMPSGASAWTNLGDGGAYGGSATPTLIVSGATYAMNGDQFQCVVSNPLGTAISPADSLQVNPVGVTTLAGLAGDAGYANGTFRAALFNSPGAVRTDRSGNIYVADNTNNVIRMITPGGVVTTIAGSPGVAGSSDGPATGGAEFSNPSGVAIDAAGNIYVADGANDTVRKISFSNSVGVVSTLAGLAGQQGSLDGTGSSARFENPQNIAIDASGNLYVPDGSGDTIRMITPGGTVSTVAGLATVSGNSDGTGANARFSNPTGVAVDGSGNLFVADYGNNSIREIAPGGVVTTIAGSTSGFSGSSDGPGTTARFNSPAGIAVDLDDNLYVADSGNDTIREISSGGMVSTVAGSAGSANTTDGLGANARFDTPADIAADDSSGFLILYVADNTNNTLRRIVPGVLVAPQISEQPSNASVGAGQTAVFTVTVSGSSSPPLTYQWQRKPEGGSAFINLTDGGAFSGSATATLTITGVTAPMSGDQYQCVVSNNAGSATSSAATLTVLAVPVITGSPSSEGVNTGSTLVLTAVASGATSFQWTFNGSTVLADSPNGTTTDIISGSSGPQLVITNATAASAGSYTVVAINATGSSSPSAPAMVTVAANTDPGALVNISSRAFVGTGDNILIGGFYIVGSTSRTVLIQALGPALSGEGVTGVLPHPSLSIFDTSGRELYSNTGWGSSQVLLNAAAAVYASPVLQPNSPDSELLLTLPPGGYTAEVSDANGATGVALCAIYQLP